MLPASSLLCSSNATNDHCMPVSTALSKRRSGAKQEESCVDLERARRGSKEEVEEHSTDLAV